MTEVENRIHKLFEQLVPTSGKADTVAGEIVRAISRIGYRNWNDGDHVGVGYGKETCNPAARYLMERAGENVANIIAQEVWGIEDDSKYDEAVAHLEAAVLRYIDEHPELKTAPNSEDMWDFRNKDEDVDDWEDDEDEYEEDDWEDEE